MSNSHHSSDDTSHGSVTSYDIGFVLSSTLTAIPFSLLMSPSPPTDTTIATVLVFAIIQILVHLPYFLHLDFTSAQRNNVMAFALTTMVIVLLVGLSLWISFSVHRDMRAHCGVPDVTEALYLHHQAGYHLRYRAFRGR
ncbi:cytochrome o ubiquinol oxidase subunit IV [Pseudomonas syringae]|nr:cytochrome o ubiquinol oxidase subunit IV [Pseudomonas syringae]